MRLIKVDNGSNPARGATQSNTIFIDMAMKFLSVFISCGKIMDWSVQHPNADGTNRV